jgi:hypothetical protein
MASVLDSSGKYGALGFDRADLSGQRVRRAQTALLNQRVKYICQGLITKSAKAANSIYAVQ